MRLLALALPCGLAATSLAQTAQHCPPNEKNLCYSVNVPDQTASSGNGDIFFQIQGPSTKQWIGLGQGGQMAGANIFIIYSDAGGTNVTLSPRLGKGNVQPHFDNGAQVFLLEGSGIANGKMTANIRCSNCASWNGGKMDLTSSSSSWIWAARSGSPINDNSQSTNLQQHSDVSDFTLDLTQARGGSSLNPFSTSSSNNSSSSGTASTTANSGSSTAVDDSSSTGRSEGSSSSSSATTAHGAILGLAFLILFPMGAFLVRLSSFRGTVWLHAGMQIFAYILALVGLGLGIYIATDPIDILGESHSVIGLVVIILLLLQLILGYVHHLIYVRTQRPTIWSTSHVWFGRAVITLGIINGGLGLELAGNSKTGEIAYGVIAGLVWISWMGVVIWSGLRPKGRENSEMRMKKLPGSPIRRNSNTGGDEEGAPIR